MRLINADALKRKAQKEATEAWKMNIKAPVETILNQFIDWIDDATTVDVPDTNDGETISRQAAIDAIVNTVSRIGLHDNSEVARYGATFRQHEIIDIIESLPSAQPETAKRIVGKSKDGMTLWYQCDMCNEPVDAQDNFCRGCGRRLTDG